MLPFLFISYTNFSVDSASDMIYIFFSSKSIQGSEYTSRMALLNSDIDGMNVKTRSGSDIPDSHIYRKSRKPSFSNSGSYYPRSNSSVEFTEGTVGDRPGIGSRDEYGSRRRPGFEVTTMDTVPRYPNMQAFDGKMREKRAECWSQKYNHVSARVAFGENTENEDSDLTARRNGYPCSIYKGLRREVIKVFFLSLIVYYCITFFLLANLVFSNRFSGSDI